MNMRKIIAVLAAVLMLVSVLPLAVSAAPGDVIIDQNFDDGSVFSNGTAENGYMVLDGTAADWANVYAYANAIQPNVKYQITFRAKANINRALYVKINNAWSGTNVQEGVNVTTEWQNFEVVLTPTSELTQTAILCIQTGDYKSSGAIYCIDDVKVVEYVEPAVNGQIVNGDFEAGSLTGWQVHQSTAVSADAAHTGSYGANLKGNGGWGGMLNQDVPVEAGKTYEISMWLKANSQGVNVQIKDGGTSGSNLDSAWFNKTAWTQLTFTVIPTTSVICFNFCGGGTGTAEDVYVDDIVVKELKQASNDGYITNGDFETGANTPWTTYSGSTVSAEAAKDGDYGMYITNPNGGWGGTAYQDFTVEVGKTYVVMMDAKAISQGQNIQIQNNGANKASKWFTNTSWTTLSFEFTAEATNSRINICGGGTGASEVIYVDNVFVFEKKAASNDGYVVNGDFETGTMDGLSPSQSTCVSRDAAKDGNFGLKMMGNGGWGGVGLWTINGLEAGATYKIEMDMNAIEQGFNWTLWQDSTSSGSKYCSGYFSTKAWTHIEKEFVANSGTAVLNINGGGTGNAETVYLDNLKITLVAPAHVCEIVELERVEAGCETEGYVKYGCQCGEGVYTEPIYPQGHTYDVIDHKDATCGAAGYNTLSCVDCGDSYDVAIEATGEHSYTYDCDKNCAACGNETRPEAAHEYFNDCETVCMICYEETREAAHNVIHAEAVEATCVAGGNIEYWYCDVCGSAWLDAECIQNTNLRAVKLPATGEHAYTNEFDIDCNECGDVREIVAPVIDVKLSISEDVNGLAFRFEANVAGFSIKAGTFVQADYTNATYNGYVLIETGAIASNGADEITIKGERMCDLDENGKALFAYRIINIPEEHQADEITMTPYYIVEIDGVATTIYGEAQTGAYAEVAIG